MKKDFSKKLLAMATVTTMVTASLPMMAFASGTGTVALTSAVTAPKYNIGVPKTVSVTLNPQLVGVATADEYAMKGLTSPTLAFVNLSNLPLAVNVSLLPKVTSDTTYVTDPDDIPMSKDDTSKKILAYAEFATGITAAPSTTTYDPTVEANKPIYTTAANFAALDNIQFFGDGVSNDFMLVLKEATYASSTATAASAITTDCIAAFKLGGQVSAYGGWKTTDFVVSVVYDAQTIVVAEESEILTGSGKLDPVGLTPGTSDSFRTFGVTSGFEARQINLGTSDTTGVDVALITGTFSDTDTAAEFYTTAACTTKVAATSTLVPTWGGTGASTPGSINFKSSGASAFKAATTVYVQFKDTNGVVLGVYPITVIPYL